MIFQHNAGELIIALGSLETLHHTITRTATNQNFNPMIDTFPAKFELGKKTPSNTADERAPLWSSTRGIAYGLRRKEVFEYLQKCRHVG